MNSMKRQKDMTLEDEPPRSEGVQCTAGEEQRAITNSSRNNEQLNQSSNDAQLWTCLVLKVSESRSVVSDSL